MAVAPAVSPARQRWWRLSGADRITGLDLARGLAVLGMFAAHLYELPEVEWGDPVTWTGIADGRSSILFATIAGISLGLMSGGRAPLAGDALTAARGRIAVRAALIWMLGIALMLLGVPVYVILPAYGILFLLSLPFLGLRAPVLWALAAGCALVTPFVYIVLDALPLWEGAVGEEVARAVGWQYPFVVWISFLLAGLACARSNVRRLRTQAAMLLGGVVLAGAAYSADALTTASADPWSAVWTADPHSSGLLEVVGSGGFALAVVGACLLVCRTVVVWVVLPLRAVGSMPLTAYVGQLVAWSVWALLVLGDPGDLVGFRDLDPFPAFALATLVLCTVWALLVGRGPLEWALDRAVRLATRR